MNNDISAQATNQIFVCLSLEYTYFLVELEILKHLNLRALSS